MTNPTAPAVVGQLRRRTLRQCLNAAEEAPSDGTVGSVERLAGIRHRVGLWRRAGAISRRLVPTPQLPDDASPQAQLAFRGEMARQSQTQVQTAMQRCRRLAGLREYRGQWQKGKRAWA